MAVPYMPPPLPPTSRQTQTAGTAGADASAGVYMSPIAFRMHTYPTPLPRPTKTQKLGAEFKMGAFEGMQLILLKLCVFVGSGWETVHSGGTCILKCISNQMISRTIDLRKLWT